MSITETNRPPERRELQCPSVFYKSIPCGDFHPLVVKSEVFTPGAFTLTHIGAPAFELWIPPLTAATAEGTPDLYDPYAADFLAGAIPEGSRLFNSPLTGTEVDFHTDFILPTNRVVWVRANTPGSTTLTYSYSKTVMGVAIRFKDTLTINTPPFGIHLDADNDGQIAEITTTAGVRENQYKRHAPGKILPVNGHGVAAHIDELAEIRLIYPSSDSGSITLDATHAPYDAGDIPFVLYADTNRTQRITLPYTNDNTRETPPETLYADAVANGTTTLTLTYITPEGITLTDTAHLTAIPTISYAPGRNENAAIWAPLKDNNLNDENNLGFSDAEKLEEIIVAQGWKTVVWYEDETGDSDANFGGCTRNDYKTIPYYGLINIVSHGLAHEHHAVYTAHTEEGLTAARNWIGPETDMFLRDAPADSANPGRTNGYYIVCVSSKWLADNWKQRLDENNAITVWSICRSAEGGTNSVMEAAGGRWMIGYSEPTRRSEITFVNENFFRRLNGEINGGNFRTTGETYTSFESIRNLYQHPADTNGVVRTGTSVRMKGNPWTTLCPAPAKTTAFFPRTPSTDSIGFGCVLFDTYIHTETEPSQIVVSERDVSISGIHWICDHGGAFGIGFTYHRNGQNRAGIRVDAAVCKNSGIAGGRQLDGNRMAPNENSVIFEF